MAATAQQQQELIKFFTDVKAAVRKHPSLVEQIGGVFHFMVKGPPAISYVVDLKNAPGDVYASLPSKAADCTIEYKTVADFVAINAGKLDLKRAIFTGKLKVGATLP
jgi:hypothetical protein